MNEPRFCPICDVSFDLHGVSDVADLTEWDCEHAGRKADLLREMEAAFGGVR